MTLQIDGVDVISAIEVAAWVGSIVAMLVIGLLVYLMVRPPRSRRETPALRTGVAEHEELVRTMEVMERRLDLLERAVADQRREDEDLLGAGAERPETRRLK